jgi:hypothetical protein
MHTYAGKDWKDFQSCLIKKSQIMKQDDMKTKPNRFDHMLEIVTLFTCAIGTCHRLIKGTVIDFMKHMDVNHYGKLPREVEKYNYKFNGMFRDYAKGIDYFDIDGIYVRLNYTEESPKKSCDLSHHQQQVNAIFDSFITFVCSLLRLADHLMCIII